MVKPRKPPQAKKRKKLTKAQLIIPVALGGAGTAFAIIINMVLVGPPPLEQCIPGEDVPFDQRAFLNVTLDGQHFTVPANIGITSECITPLHTHEDDGEIHMQFFKPTRFTLGNFIKLWGLDLSKYDVKIFVKNVTDDDFSEVDPDVNTIFFGKDMKIRMELTSR
ncbi:MAG: hypothetical protein ACRD38_04905 [Nitrososphaerales archaeon]